MTERGATERLALASGSPRRAALLAQAGIAHVVVPAPSVDESWAPPEHPVDHARRVASAKLAAARQAAPSAPLILTADTNVWVPGRPAPLGKPADRAKARAILQALAGREQRVTTAFCLDRADGRRWLEHTTTRVWFRPLGAAELEAWLATDEWADKAGAWAVQGAAGSFVARLEGSLSGVVGLPLAEVVAALAALGGPRPHEEAEP